jgi:glycine betaine catabolism B
METQVTEVLSVREETPTVRSIRLRRPPDFAFQASQAARLVLQPGALARPFSIASGPERPHLEFAARRSGSDFKRVFFALRPGDAVEILGPKGRFLLEEGAPAVLVAGGIGITPMKSMLEHAVDAELSTPITLLYGSRSPGEIAFRGEIDELARCNARIRVVHTVSEPDAGWTGRVGRLGPELLVEACEQAGAFYYVAGPPEMVEETLRNLQVLGVARERVKFEIFRGYR